MLAGAGVFVRRVCGTTTHSRVQAVTPLRARRARDGRDSKTKDEGWQSNDDDEEREDRGKGEHNSSSLPVRQVMLMNKSLYRPRLSGHTRPIDCLLTHRASARPLARSAHLPTRLPLPSLVWTPAGLPHRLPARPPLRSPTWHLFDFLSQFYLLACLFNLSVHLLTGLPVHSQACSRIHPSARPHIRPPACILSYPTRPCIALTTHANIRSTARAPAYSSVCPLCVLTWCPLIPLVVCMTRAVA
ncbi:uncharacterized protein B0H18DRAFT_357988 [Fomitopsis serialis]|uniref:uncharacterized protein n=1 Tax=Fomitopsis serialis TaxID=139415 RepID=UPI0020073B48|nr:uncharacterized protein B0H18DRAFT_357988 [Neoantrodia serialis]KAH9911506.1 hypothetical protein B0H18DRAFT_357988 [Neoantrodia serialis]